MRAAPQVPVSLGSAKVCAADQTAAAPCAGELEAVYERSASASDGKATAKPASQPFGWYRSQTITFDAIPHQTAGWGGTLGLVATASSGLPVSFGSLTPSTCAISQTSLLLLAAGICTVQANQGGNDIYAPAPPVPQSISIWRLRQKIAFDQTPQQTQGPGGTTPLIATADSGLTVSFSSSTPRVCGVSGTNATLLAPGICTIQGNQPGDSEYRPAEPVWMSFSIWH
jgi:hypothetical protein